MFPEKQIILINKITVAIIFAIFLHKRPRSKDNQAILDPCATTMCPAPKFYNKRCAAAVIFVAELNSSRICKTCQAAKCFFGAISAQTEFKATAIENQSNVQKLRWKSMIVAAVRSHIT